MQETQAEQVEREVREWRAAAARRVAARAAAARVSVSSNRTEWQVAV